MTCYGPLAAYRPKGGSGRLVFDSRKSETGLKLMIPCGQCVGCRLDRAKQWAIRCMHEKQMHRQSSFVTLTYDPKKLPEGGSLRMVHYQSFMKRVREARGEGVRFMGCGEYGDITRRPHYHILLLNVGFAGKRIKVSDKGHDLYTSAELDGMWPHGIANFGTVDYDSCSYVAGYCVKSLKARDMVDFSLYCPETGIVKEPPFMTMSRRPGIGASWYDKFGPHSYEWDSVVFKSHEVRPPRYYDNKRVGPCINDRLKVIRRRKAKMYRVDQTLARLRVREVVALAKLNLKGKVL